MRESLGATKPEGAMKVKARSPAGLGGIPAASAVGRTTGDRKSVV